MLGRKLKREFELAAIEFDENISKIVLEKIESMHEFISKLRNPNKEEIVAIYKESMDLISNYVEEKNENNANYTDADFPLVNVEIIVQEKLL